MRAEVVGGTWVVQPIVRGGGSIKKIQNLFQAVDSRYLHLKSDQKHQNITLFQIIMTHPSLASPPPVFLDPLPFILLYIHETLIFHTISHQHHI